VQCKNSGIDCKIHHIDLQGRVQSDDPDFSCLSYSFLASDCEEGTVTNSEGNIVCSHSTAFEFR